MRDKLDKRTKWSYCVGATGRDAAYALVSMYLILYVQYTMHLTSAQFAVISGVMIVCFHPACSAALFLATAGSMILALVINEASVRRSNKK